MLLADYDGFHAIATALVIYGLAEVLGGYGFLAVFAGGIAFRRYEADHELNASRRTRGRSGWRSCWS